MRMLMDAEEKYAYDESVSNFIMLKIWYDLGIDVSNFPDFMVYPGGYDEATGAEIFEKGIQCLYSEFKYLGYEEQQQMKDICKEADISINPEGLFILQNTKINRLIDTGEIEKISKLITGQHGDLTEYEILIHKKYGILIPLYFPGLMFEIAESVANITLAINDLYKQTFEVEKDGFYHKAV